MSDNASNFNAGYNMGTISQVNHNNVTNNIEFHGFPLSQQTRALETLYDNITVAAMHNSGERCDAPKCHPETRKAVQGDIFSWISHGTNDERPRQLLWLTGPAGAGKTAVMGTISERRSKLRFVTTLAYQIQGHPRLHNQLSVDMLSAVHRDPALFQMGLTAQMEALVLEPLRASHKHRPSSNPTPPLVIVVDGLDECGEEHYSGPNRSRIKDQIEVLSVLFHALEDPAFPFRVVVASRPETWLRSFFTGVTDRVSEIFLGNHYNPNEDISLFFTSKFAELRRRYDLPSSWPKKGDVAKLIADSSGQFIYAATVIRFIDSPPFLPPSQLEIVLKIRPSAGSSPFALLDALYTSVLKSSPSPEETVLWFRALILIDSASATEEIRPSVWTIDRMFESSTGQARMLLGLPSIVHHERHPKCDSAHYGLSYNALAPIPKTAVSTYAFYHKSFLDFLQERSRYGIPFPNADDATVEQWIWQRFSTILQCAGPEVPVDDALLPTFKTCFAVIFGAERARSNGRMFLDQDLLSKCEPSRWFSTNPTFRRQMFRGMPMTFMDCMFDVVHSQCRVYRPCAAGCRKWRKAILKLWKNKRTAQT
ncbi:hypothetical protein NMY22_g7487 [Coprinellus aureogranulatus]|nr:hypothetical protein NMY22_g7487 [Coprinellus aureogranulatus]